MATRSFVPGKVLRVWRACGCRTGPAPQPGLPPDGAPVVTAGNYGRSHLAPKIGHWKWRKGKAGHRKSRDLRFQWSGWPDLNRRPLRPEANARCDLPPFLPCLTCFAPSVDVRWRPLVSVAVVTHLVTHPPRGAVVVAAGLVPCQATFALRSPDAPGGSEGWRVTRSSLDTMDKRMKDLGLARSLYPAVQSK